MYAWKPKFSSLAGSCALKWSLTLLEHEENHEHVVSYSSVFITMHIYRQYTIVWDKLNYTLKLIVVKSYFLCTYLYTTVLNITYSVWIGTTGITDQFSVSGTKLLLGSCWMHFPHFYLFSSLCFPLEFAFIYTLDNFLLAWTVQSWHSLHINALYLRVTVNF